MSDDEESKESTRHRESRAGKVRVQLWLDRRSHRILRHLAIEAELRGVEIKAGELLTKALDEEAVRTGLAAIYAAATHDPPNDTADDVEAGSRASLAAMQRIVDGGLEANIAHRRKPQP